MMEKRIGRLRMHNCHCRAHNGFLTAKGLEEAEQRRANPTELLEVDVGQLDLYLDKVGSVSALVEVEGDYDYDPRHVELNRRLINHGS